MIAVSQKVYNFDSVKVKENSKEALIKNAVATDDTALYKAIKYTVYKSKNGKIFFVIQSKSGNWYKKYIKTTN
jgi:hypothetical protein